VHCDAPPPPTQHLPRAATPTYVRRDPAQGTLHRLVRDHLATFLDRCRERSDGRDVPTFVRRALLRFLDCGVLQKGFCRFRCEACGLDHLVALTCKGRGFCPSCGGKRMTDLAAHLVDHVVPFVPVRQLVLSLPPRLRYLLAYDHTRCGAVLRIFARAVRGFYRARAAEHGVTGGHTGAVTFIQRFGSAANLNLHFHMLALDGVFIEQADGTLRFHSARPFTNDDVTALVATVRVRVERWLARKGLLDDDSFDDLGDEAPLLAHSYATSIAGQSALDRPFSPIRRIGHAEGTGRIPTAHALRAHDEGFDLHAGLRVAAQHATARDALERLMRYCARPPLADDRLQLRGDGRVLLELKTPWHDGTTHLDLDPLDFLARCAALIPRPHKNLVVYHGVLAAHARLRSRAVQYERPPQDSTLVPREQPHCRDHENDRHAEKHGPTPVERPRSSARRGLWADLMRRAFGFDLLTCPRCGGKMALLACILDRPAIARILGHLGLPTEPPALAPARASPIADLWSDEVA